MAEDLHVVFGSGPVGTWIARALVEHGQKVRVVNRSGRRPGLLPDSAEIATADASVQAEAAKAASGATVVYQAMNPPYHRWHELFPALQAGALAAAKAASARYVSIDNLYMYDASRGPISADTSLNPASKKGELRLRMAQDVLDAHERGEVQTTILRSSDYYGPGVTDSALGARVFEPILAGKRGEVLGELDQAHSYAYIEDVGRAAAALGSSPEALGRVWIAPHAPARTQRQVLERVFALVGREPAYSVMTRSKLRLGGIFVPEAREMIEMMYEFAEPFVVDSSATEQAFALEATPFDEGLDRTVNWYRMREGRA